MISMDSLAIGTAGAYYTGNENKAVPESRGEGWQPACRVRYVADSEPTIFEVHVSVGDNWSVYSAAHDKERAVQIALSPLAMNQFEAVKVTVEDQKGHDKVVYTKEGRDG